MTKLTAEGYCGKQHTLDELEACADCSAIHKVQSSVGIRDIGAEAGMQPINETHSAIKTAVAKRNEEEYRRIWNSAIECAYHIAIKASESPEGIKVAEEVRKLKK